MSAHTMLFVLVPLSMSGLLNILPGLTRPDLFFAVTVSPPFRSTSVARRILRKYRAIVWGSALAAIAFELTARMEVAALLLQAVGFLWAPVNAHGSALAYAAAAPNSVVEVDLAAPRERLHGGPIIAALPVVSLVALAIWASLHLDSLPPRFPVHWGIRGPDRWVNTTPVSIFGYLATNASVCLLLIGRPTDFCTGRDAFQPAARAAPPSVTFERVLSGC
jgi:uncharacterized membrane protein